LGLGDESYVVGGDALGAELFDFLFPAQTQEGDVEVGDVFVGGSENGVEGVQTFAPCVVIADL
jgi:hypothetical protein